MISREAPVHGLTAESESSTSRSDAVPFVAALLLPLGLFAALGTAVIFGTGLDWDTEILRFAQSRYEASIVDPLDAILKISIVLGAAMAVGTLVMLLARGRRTRARFFAVVAAGVPVLDVLLKEIFRRPALGAGHEGSYSFPSGNAMGSAAIVAAIALISSPHPRRRVLAVGVPFVIAYGIALVYAWWHYPTDVVAGWCVALSWVTGLWLVLGPGRSSDGFSAQAELTRGGRKPPKHAVPP